MSFKKQKLSNEESIKLMNDRIICSICGKKIIFAYQCLECENYFCSLCFDEWKHKNGSLCHFNCYNSSFRKLEVINNSKNHFENIYYLKLYKELDNRNLLNKISSNHLSNAFHSIYHRHTLFNRFNYDHKYYDWICDICGEKYKLKTISYRCDTCDFDICSNCRLKEESGFRYNNIFLSKYHEHLLIDVTFKESNWICDVCDKRYGMQTIKRFRCEKCDFDICNSCKSYEIQNVNGIIYSFLINIFDFSFIINLKDDLLSYIN